MKFYLGTHKPQWLWSDAPARWPWFVSHRTLRERVNLRPATSSWALDSGGFTELSMFGEWRTTTTDYVAATRRYANEIGRLEWAAPQDWMCEPFMLAKTGLTVAQHQQRTIDNYLELRLTAADLPYVPVLQGWAHDDYLQHRDSYASAGVDLTAEPTVGIGSVCRRAHLDEAAAVIARLHADGIALHGFGIKADGVKRYGRMLASSDSLAWSFAGRRRGVICGRRPHGAKSCANCRTWAEQWAQGTTSHIGNEPVQLQLGA